MPVSSASTKKAALMVNYGYDTLLALTSIQYPNSQTLTVRLDELERPISLTDNNNYTWATGVICNPANQFTTDEITGQSAPCPTVWWQGWEIWSPSANGKVVPSGADYVVSP